jgi:hypothetical protein
MGSFFEAGGWGMYPTLLFGFFMVAAAGLYALRNDERYAKAWFALAVATWGAGVLGTALGLVTTVHYVSKLAPAEQFGVFIQGLEESLHNVILALIIVIPTGLIAAVGTVRRASGARPVAAG